MINKVKIIRKTLVIGVFILFIGIVISPSTAISYNKTKINHENELNELIFEESIEENDYKNVNDFKGNSWTLYPSDDTFIEKILPDENYGPLNYIKIGRNGNGYFEEDALLKFNTSSISSETNVFAKLYLYYYDYIEEPNDRKYSLYRITNNWDEYNVTWNTQPSYEATPTDVLLVPDYPNVWLEFDVTNDVRNFIEGRFENFGWIISDDDNFYPEGQREADIYSKENGNFIPYLFVKEPDTIYVDDDNVNGPWDGTKEYPFNKIQDGIENSFSGDTIYVFNGTYNESVVIYEEHVNLIGESKENTIIFNKEKQYVVLVRNRYYGITISGFTVKTDTNNEEGYAGIALDIYSYNNYITDNIIFNNEVGVIIWGSDNNYVLNNTISDNIGICFKGGNDNNIISNNRIIDVVTGISSEDNSTSNIIEYNDISNAQIGIDLKHNTKNTNINQNIVSNTDNGIYLNGYLNNSVTNNLLDNNNNGIYAHNANSKFSIFGNTIIENKNGIYIDDNVYGNISGNFIENNTCGIYCRGGRQSKSLFIYNNNIAKNKNSGGIFTNHAINCKIYNNNFINNKPNAKFVTFFNQEFGSLKNLWYDNYWDDLKESTYRISGRIGFIFCLLPWFKLDNQPAIEPFDI
ncbi:MAG: hypothetical protein AYK22_01745 [Thermoplasmatales archaeon SG8-52-3]|nr:MAG: hypothetical protein AYK22_01745 [Thermoplasmatales archaeon SG8-52-3]